MHKAGSRHTDIRHESTSMHTPGQEGLQMIEATSCGGVVIFRGKLLVLYKNYRNKYEGWVLPKGTVEPGEDFKQTASGRFMRRLASPLHHQVHWQKPVHLQHPSGYHRKDRALVSDDGGQLLQQAAARRILRRFRLLQILRSLPPSEIFQRKTDPGKSLQ